MCLSWSFLVPVQLLSSPFRVPRLFFGPFLCFLSCRCFSPVLCVYPPPAGFPFGYSGVGFLSWGCGCFYCSVLLLLFFLSSIAAAVSSAPLFCLLRFLLYPLLFFRPLRFQVFLPAFFRIFSRAAAAPSLLFPLVFRMLRLRLLPLVFLRFCLLWRLRLLPTILLWLLFFLFAISPESVPQVSILPFFAFLLFLTQDSSFFIALFPRAAGSVFVSSSLCFFEVFFASASVPPLLLHLAIFRCLSCFLLSLPRSDLRFPLQCGLPLGRVRVC